VLFRSCLDESFDVVLVDMQMPVMDGLEATRRIRATTLAGPQPILIAMTANAFGSDRDACLLAGMNDYIAKPIDIMQLGQKLAALVPNGVVPVSTAMPAAAAQQDAVINPERLAAMRESLGPRGVLEVVESIIDDSPRLLRGVRAAMSAMDRNSIKRYAHSIRSMCAMVGAAQCKAQCETLERNAEVEDVIDLDPKLTAVETGYRIVVEALRGWLASTTGDSGATG
jgi:CheY-like chemotaxis protein